jgi:methylase of polypeptide subunit release factors
MLSQEQASRLRDLFRTGGYTVDGVVAEIGASAHRALGRNQTEPAARALAGRTDPLAVWVSLWLLQRPVSRAEVERTLPGLLEPMLLGRVLVGSGDEVRALVDIRPYATDGGDWWVCADLTPGMDGVVTPVRADFVLGVSSASTSLAQLTLRDPVHRALDVGTGCGVQVLHLAQHADTVVATDLNPRALDLAELTFQLNEVQADLRMGDLFAPLPEEEFDLIVTNPPYVMSPPHPSRLIYRETDRNADELMAQIVRDGARHLAPDGVLQILGNWVHPVDGSWQDRLAGWLADTGCDAHVVQREVLDPSEYVELWLADAGLTGSPQYRQRYSAWLDYFEAQQIAAVGLGWLVLHRTDHSSPDLRLEEWPYAVEQPIAPAIGRGLRAVQRLRALDDAAFTGRRWRVTDDVIVEMTSLPGAADPQHIVFRQRRGFRRAEAVDTALAGVLGACDGELPLGLIIDSVAQLLELPAADLRADLVPRVRDLVRDGLLEEQA